MFVKAIISSFIDRYCTEVQENETPEYVELMMDNHKCIEWGDKQYYLPEENSLWNDDENFIAEILATMCEV